MKEKLSPYYWLAEPLLDLPSLVESRMFGCDAIYVHGRLQLVLPQGKEEPWMGVLFPVDRSSHPSLIKQFPAITPHSKLGKWLYISEGSDNFEQTAQEIVHLIARNDPRLGVESKDEQKSRKRKVKNLRLTPTKRVNRRC